MLVSIRFAIIELNLNRVLANNELLGSMLQKQNCIESGNGSKAISRPNWAYLGFN